MRVALVSVLLSGCLLMIEDPRAGDPQTCQLRNPSTGTCSDAACDGSEEIGGACEGVCDALDNDTCVKTPGCHLAIGSEGDEAGIPLGCWNIAPMPLLANGNCDAFDAVTCAEAEDCISNLMFDSKSAGFIFSFCSSVFVPVPAPAGD